MKKETLIKVIDEEFGDALEMSWLVDVYLKAFIKNDNKIKAATIDYENQSQLVRKTLSELYRNLKIMEKAELEKGVRILHKRKTIEDEKKVKAELKKERE